MKKKTAPEMTVLMHEGKSTLANLLNYAGDKPQRLVHEAVKNGLHPTGPQYWIYEGGDGKPETEMTVKICLPVASFGKAYEGSEFKIEKLPAFTCFATEHIGAYQNLSETYCSLMQKVQEENKTMNGICREMYVNCDFENQENCITEVQIGIM
jgi:effector-binding domain-containing protein